MQDKYERNLSSEKPGFIKLAGLYRGAVLAVLAAGAVAAMAWSGMGGSRESAGADASASDSKTAGE